MKIDLISDTHEMHYHLYDLHISKVEMIICAGDVANHKIPAINNNKMRDFLTWFSSLPHKYKIFVPGNHDVSIQDGLVKPEEYSDIIFLIHEEIIIEGIKIFGSPYTPTFGTNWAYNVPRNKIGKYWEEIPENTDILITHGPPMGILDSTETKTYTKEKMFKHVGCKALLSKVIEVNPKYHIFGHLHDEKHVLNHGFRNTNRCDTVFINASVVDLSHTFTNEHLTIEI